MNEDIDNLFSDEMDSVNAVSRHIIASAFFTSCGLVLSSKGHRAFNYELIGSISSAMFSLMTKLSNEISTNEPAALTIETDDSRIVMVPAGDDLIFAVFADTEENIDLLKKYAWRKSNAIHPNYHCAVVGL